MSKHSKQFQMYADAVRNELEMSYQQGRADRLNEIFGMKFVFETEGKQKDITELVQRVLLEHFNNCEDIEVKK